jgi:protein transport protein DSL1/ZW10
LASKSASNVDQWINDARKLQADIERSQSTAREIAHQAESKKPYTEKIQDAASRVSFLYSEIAYSANLKQTLAELQKAGTLLEDVRVATEKNQILEALDILAKVQDSLNRSIWLQSTRPGNQLASKSDQLRAEITKHVSDSWNSLLLVKGTEGAILIRDEVQSETPFQNSNP